MGQTGQDGADNFQCCGATAAPALRLLSLRSETGLNHPSSAPSPQGVGTRRREPHTTWRGDLSRVLVPASRRTCLQQGLEGPAREGGGTGGLWARGCDLRAACAGPPAPCGRRDIRLRPAGRPWGSRATKGTPA